MKAANKYITNTAYKQKTDQKITGQKHLHLMHETKPTVSLKSIRLQNIK